MTWLEYFNLFMQCGPFIILIGLGFFVGSAVERAHFKRLRMKEKRLFTIPLNGPENATSRNNWRGGGACERIGGCGFGLLQDHCRESSKVDRGGNTQF